MPMRKDETMLRRLFMFLALATCVAQPVAAQTTPPPFYPGSAKTDSNPEPSKLVCWTGAAWAPCGATNPQTFRELDGEVVPVTPGSTSGAVLFSATTSGFAGISFQTGTAANGATWNFQGSNDSTDGTNGNWFAINAQQLNGGAVANTQTASAGFFLPAGPLYVRVTVTGTITAATGGFAIKRSMAPFPVTLSNQTINNNKMLYWNELTNGSIAVGGAVSNARDMGVGSGGEYRYPRMACFLSTGSVASATLTLTPAGSTDNVNWVPYAAPIAATNANTVYPFETRIFFRYNRCRADNGLGGTATAGTSLATQFGE